MLSIQTNVDSLIAQQNLNTTNTFMSQTIQQLTSGYRINSSGDDAAGLAVANQQRDTISQVTQGVANGNDAVAQLQIMDGGMSNISSILDGMQTLATQSASSAFTGDRGTLNQQFQTDLSEINRQAQAIGLNVGGTFASNMSVYLGGGQGTTTAGGLANGTVNIDLSNSTVDAGSLGLSGVQATNSGADLNAAGVQAAVATNAASATPGITTFTFNGPGFGATGTSISVNLQGVTNASQLTTNINAAIQTAANGNTTTAAAFKAANITASMVTSTATATNGDQQLAFNSSTAAFAVTSVDATAATLFGQASLGTTTIAGGSTELAGGLSFMTAAGFGVGASTAAQTVSINALDSSGSQHSLSVNLAVGTTQATALTQINAALQSSNDSTLKQIAAVQTGNTTTSTTFNFVSTLSNFTVNVGTDAAGAADGIATAGGAQNVSLQAAQVGTGGNADISTLAGATSAVATVAAAVGKMGTAQAAVGNGEDQLGYAINLATSQITNFSAAESQIRDADIAAEAANLTKSQTLQQASIAAMAQANSAPQAILSLLKG
jgi:flagellin